jgi:hypothetical protein
MPGNERRSFATRELPEEKVEAIRASCMDDRHADLDKFLLVASATMEEAEPPAEGPFKIIPRPDSE